MATHVIARRNTDTSMTFGAAWWLTWGDFFVLPEGGIFSLPDETSDIPGSFTPAPNEARTCSNMMRAYIYPVPGQSGQHELI